VKKSGHKKKVAHHVADVKALGATFHGMSSLRAMALMLAFSIHLT
jgi:hypothetical protein